jgi:hypothetical protein
LPRPRRKSRSRPNSLDFRKMRLGERLTVKGEKKAEKKEKDKNYSAS